MRELRLSLINKGFGFWIRRDCIGQCGWSVEPHLRVGRRAGTETIILNSIVQVHHHFSSRKVTSDNSKQTIDSGCNGNAWR
jgi:hypothetical protein